MRNISFALFLILFLVSCTTLSKRGEPQGKTYDEIYDLSLEEADTLLKEHILSTYYELASSEQKYFYQTLWIKGPHPFQPKKNSLTEEQKYRLTFELIDLTKPEDFKSGFPPRILIRITKEVEMNAGFPKGWFKTSSDGLEEEALLYRFDRLIKLKKEEKI